MFTDHGRARVEVPVLLTDVEHVLEGTGLEDIAGCQMERAREALYLRAGQAVQAATGSIQTTRWSAGPFPTLRTRTAAQG